MEKQKCISDYLSALRCRQEDELRRPSFLYLADYIGVDTGCEFSYHHNSITCGQEKASPNTRLDKGQMTKLDVLAEQETSVLDILCTFARFSKLGYSGERLVKVAEGLKKQFGNSFDHAMTLSKQILGIDVTPKLQVADTRKPNLATIDLPPGLAAVNSLSR